jgi:hypothetical protein
LASQIRAAEKDPTDVDTPISSAIDLQQLRRSGNPMEKSAAEIISMLQSLHAKIDALPTLPARYGGATTETAPFVIELHEIRKRKNQLRKELERLRRMLETQRSISVTKEDLSKQKILRDQAHAVQLELENLMNRESELLFRLQL